MAPSPPKTDQGEADPGCQRQPLRLRQTTRPTTRTHDSHAACPSREETFVIEGTLIAESLRVGTNLENLKLTVRKISRVRPEGTAADQPKIWTLLDFEAAEAEADDLAQAFARGLDDQPSWYVDFRSLAETFVVFPGRIFRYQRGDDAGRSETQAYGRQLAIPEAQLDWPI